jgi:hypothetical protein
MRGGDADGATRARATVGGEAIDIALNQEDLTQLTNLSRSSAGRILSYFRTY